jgi:hypothetical protein
VSREHINGFETDFDVSQLPGRAKPSHSPPSRSRQSRAPKSHESFPSVIGLPLGRNGRET